MEAIQPHLFFCHPYYRGVGNGRVSLTSLPFPTTLSNSTLPPCSSMTLLVIGRPRPSPSCFVEKNGSNIFSRSSCLTPLPLSLTVRTKVSFTISSLILRTPAVFDDPIA